MPRKNVKKSSFLFAMMFRAKNADCFDYLRSQLTILPMSFPSLRRGPNELNEEADPQQS
jgi:hypothetical protein